MKNKLHDTVVILNQASGYLQLDMLHAYSKKYKCCVLIAGSLVTRSSSFQEDWIFHRVCVYDRKTTFRRIYTWLAGTLGMLWIVLTRYRKAHIVAITNPPFSVFIPWFLRCSYDIVIYDMYPDALVEYNFTTRSSIFYRLWSFLNRFTFRGARKVFALTEGMKERANHYMSSSNNVEVVHLWSNSEDFEYVKRSDNFILKKTQSQDKFTIVYSGNLGLTHPLEKLVNLAGYLEPTEFSIIIIGEGAKTNRLKQLVQDLGYEHVYFLPWQPIEYFSHNLHAADINVVTLDQKASNLSIPSKTFNILTIGNPILAICSKQSALANIVYKYNCGIVSDGCNMEEVAKKIKVFKETPAELKRLRMNSEKASRSFTKTNAEAYL